MAELAEQKREDYKDYAPVFYRPKPGVRDQHASFLASQIQNSETHIALVHEADAQHLDGFVVATLTPAPPVYDPGGLTALVDDFIVEMPDLWAGVGRSLLDAVIREAEPRGAVQTVVVCGPQDRAKREMLLTADHIVASEWLTLPFAE
jgi:hypothetical protein